MSRGKFFKGQRYTKAKGKPCPYCQRPMTFDSVLIGLFPTVEHTTPRSKGGRHTIMACWDCNQIKRDMLMPEWQEFMVKNPRWWDKDYL